MKEKRVINREINSVAITGPTGAIGMAIIGYCIKQNIELILITHKESKRNIRIPDSDLINIIYSDITEYDCIETEVTADAFVHLAWTNTIGEGRNNVEAQLKNVECTLAAVRLAKRLKCRVFLGAGSQAEYGRVDGYLNSAVGVFPENGYGMAKLCAGQMSRLLCSQLGIEHIWTRVLSIYGPYDGENSMIISSIKKILAGEETAFTKGEQKWDYLFSADAADMLVGLLLKGENGKTYCIGSGVCRPLKDYIRVMYESITRRICTDDEMGIGKVAYSDKQVMMLCADISELVDVIGDIEVTPFEEGIAKTIDWLNSGFGKEFVGI